MKEIRLHGIGGMGTVKAGELLVRATVKEGNYGVSMPFFGFERQGAPVQSFVRLGTKPIRPKNKVYHPGCIIVMDASLLVSANVFEGLAEGAYMVINTTESNPAAFAKSSRVGTAVFLDATAIALEELGRDIPNTILLGAFIKATGWVSPEYVEAEVAALFGEANRRAFRRGFEEARIERLEGGATA